MGYVLICPKCQSKNVNIDNSNPATGYLGLPATYVCNDCGFRGYTFPEVEE